MTGPRFVGPLSLLACCLLPVVGAFAVTTPRIGAITLVADVGLLGWLVRDPRGTVLRIAVGMAAAVTLAVSTWLYAGHDIAEAGAAALRILCIVVPAAMLSPSVRPSELGDHLAQRLRLPARPIAGAVAALQRVAGLGEQWRQIQQARRARGIGLDGGPVRRARALTGSAFALLVSAMRQTGALAMAMDARGFAAARRRTWAMPAPWQPADWLLLLIGLTLAALPHLLRG
ncbi:MAG: energy-coupling factor transporter transmembrane component T [Nocardioidaceae bacterium]